MKKALLMTMALVLMAIPAAGQSGYLGLFADQEGIDCGISDAAGAFIIYVVHMDAVEASAAEFGLDLGGVPNLELTGASAISPNVLVEDAEYDMGYSIGYGGCFASPRAIMQIIFFGSATEPCSQIRMDRHPNPDIDAIQIADCNNNKIPVEGRGMFVNPTDDCSDCSETPVGTEIDTWGSLKSLYR